jgi:hypothetical protein
LAEFFVNNGATVGFLQESLGQNNSQVAKNLRKN